MNKYSFGLMGVVLLCGGALLGQAAAAAASDAAGCGAASCGQASCAACCDCCPHCGCKLVPVCHTYCTTKKVTEYKYTCVCEEKCIPGPVRPCNGCDKCAAGGECGGGCDAGNGGCQDCCGCRCRVVEVRKLVKIPCCKEEPVRKCTVEWVCPHCGGGCACGATPSPAPTAAPAAPSPAPQTPLPAVLPAAPKTTGLAPRLWDSGLVQQMP